MKNICFTLKCCCSNRFNRYFRCSGSELKFEDEVTSLQLQVNKLRTLGVNKIIALGHSGFTVDQDVAKKVRGVDVVIGGHTNTFLFTGEEVNTAVKPFSCITFIFNICLMSIFSWCCSCSCKLSLFISYMLDVHTWFRKQNLSVWVILLVIDSFTLLLTPFVSASWVFAPEREETLSLETRG